MFLYNRAKQLQGCYKGCLGVISWRSMINGCRKNALVRRRFALAVCTKQPKIYCIRKRINKKDDVCWTMFNRIFRFSPSAHQGRTHGPAALQQNQYSNNPDSQFFDRSLLIYLLIQISMWTFRRSVSVAIPLSDTLTKGRLCVRRAPFSRRPRNWKVTFVVCGGSPAHPARVVFADKHRVRTSTPPGTDAITAVYRRTAPNKQTTGCYRGNLDAELGDEKCAIHYPIAFFVCFNITAIPPRRWCFWLWYQLSRLS